MIIDLNSFTGKKPKINERQIPVGTATTACNFKTNSGFCIDPYSVCGTEMTSPEITAVKTFMVYPATDVRVWPPVSQDLYMYWAEELDVCEGFSTLPGVGGGVPSLVYTGDGGAPKQVSAFGYTIVFPLGIGQPNSPPVIEEYVVFDSSLSSEDKETYKSAITSVAYCYTVVDNFGQESQPSTPSEYYDVYDYKGGEGIKLTGFSVPEGGVPGGTGESLLIRVYRCQSGSGGDADFFMIGETSLNIFSPENSFFNDYSAQAKSFIPISTDILATADWASPPDDMIGMTRFSNSVLAGFREASNILCFSEPFVQYAWPLKYQLKMPQKILGLVCLGDELVVFMPSVLYSVKGEPGALTATEIYGSKGTPCIKRRGFVKTEHGVLFPGHDGLYLYNGATCQNLTIDSLSTIQWRSLLPDLFHGVYYDGNYWAMRTTENIVVCINIFDGSVIDIDMSSIPGVLYGAHVDYHGRLWIQKTGKVYPWSEGEDRLTASWSSGLITLTSPANLSTAIITSDSPTNEHLKRLIIQGHYKGVASIVFDSEAENKKVEIPFNAPFRLPSGFLVTAIKLDIETTVPIASIRIATSMSELSGIN